MIDTEGLCVEMRRSCRICRREWLHWLAAMRAAAFEAGMLPGQENALRLRSGGTSPEKASVQLIVAGDGDIAAVNLRNLGCFGPTNILSFPGGDDGQLGTLFLSVDTLERESVLYGQNVSVHARRLLAHGMGHITGFDHGPDMDEFCAWLEESCPLPGESTSSAS